MKRSILLLALWCAASAPTLAAEMRIVRDLPYAEPKNERQTLDVYAPVGAKQAPVAFWIHGGGWQRGDKSSVQRKPQALVDRGFVFVSTNYRFVPNVKIPEMMADIARSLRWVHDHAAEYGGDGRRIVVLGHSAGAHLAALAATDERYLKAEGLSLSILKGCVPIDVSMYDIPKRLADFTTRPNGLETIFGTDPAQYKELSPVTYVAPGRNIPPFLILHVADRPETKEQSHWLAEKLRQAGSAATVFAGEGKTHGSISGDLGLPDDPPTAALYKFLDEVAGPK